MVVCYPRLINHARPEITNLVLTIARKAGRATRGFWSGEPGRDLETTSDGPGTTEAFVLRDSLAERLLSIVETSKRADVW
jgi:hypothetical protein